MQTTQRPATTGGRVRPSWWCAWIIGLGFWVRLGNPVAADDSPAVTPEMATFFEARVRPVLVEKCANCHGATKQSGGLRVDSRTALIEGGDAGPAIVAGDPDKSLLVQAIRHQGDAAAMPPKGGKLPDEMAGALAQWVRSGAPWPATSIAAPASTDGGKGHWAYQPVREPAAPAVGDPSWVATPVDAFILGKLEAKGLAPSPEADKRTLIRRVTFDLTGLPPTAQEVEDFLADGSPGAFAKVVDRLLVSPRYGERWGRHWLDVARYADTKGYVFTSETRYPYSYTYRDYVIRAFNEDLPYDKFVVEQIAADRVPSADKRNLAALGFLTVGRRFLNNQNDIIDDRIDVVTRGMLGLSVTCARCHDHKFDPIPTEDYYSLAGVFASSVEPADGDLPVLPSDAPEADRQAYDEERRRRLDAVEHLRAATRAQVEGEVRDHLAALVEAAFALDFNPQGPKLDEEARARGVQPERLRFAARRLGKLLDKAGDPDDPVTGAWVRFAKLPAAEFADRAGSLAWELVAHPDPAHPVDPAVLEAFAAPVAPPKDLAEVAARYGRIFERAAKSHAPQPEVGPPSVGADPALASIHRRLAEGDNAALAVPAAGERVFNRLEKEKIDKLAKRVDELAVTHPGSPSRAMVMVDAPNPVTPHVAIRGNPGRPGKQVPRRFLRVLAAGGEAKPFVDGSGRLELARAIASPDNPLTPRVMVNRVWHQHFGAGLVATPSDFGARGEPPTHPELLDDLARRFVAGGWSVKNLHRLIVLSNTYRQRSEGRSDGLNADPENRLIWRYPPHRLDFEATRDAILAVAGDLDPAMGGRSVELFDKKGPSRRRTVYGLVDRYDLDSTYRTFDFASPDISTPTRPTTTVPQQALFLLNSPFLLDEARKLARRSDVAALSDLPARVDRLHRDLFGRPAEAREVELATRFVAAAPAGGGPEAPSPWELYAQVLLMTNEFATVD